MYVSLMDFESAKVVRVSYTQLPGGKQSPRSFLLKTSTLEGKHIQFPGLSLALLRTSTPF